jgi:hypothetical protein
VHLTRVQQWVGATLFLAVAGLGISAPMAYVSILMAHNGGMYDNAIGIWIMSMVVGLITMEGAWILLGHRTVSPWIWVGVLPAAVAAFWLF